MEAWRKEEVRFGMAADRGDASVANAPWRAQARAGVEEAWKRAKPAAFPVVLRNNAQGLATGRSRAVVSPGGEQQSIQRPLRGTHEDGQTQATAGDLEVQDLKAQGDGVSIPALSPAVLGSGLTAVVGPRLHARRQIFPERLAADLPMPPAAGRCSAEKPPCPSSIARTGDPGLLLADETAAGGRYTWPLYFCYSLQRECRAAVQSL